MSAPGPTAGTDVPPTTGAPGPRTTDLGRVARGGALNLAGSVVTAAAAFGFTVLVTRSLPAAEAGTLFTLTSVFVVAYSTARLGAPTGLVYFLARQRATGEQRLLAVTVHQAVAVVAVVAVVVGVLGLVLAGPIVEAAVGEQRPGAVTLTRVLAACLVAAALGDVWVGATRGMGAMRPLVALEKVARPLLQILGAGAVLLLGWADPLSLGLAWVLPFVVTSAGLALWSRRLRAGVEARQGIGPQDRGRARDVIGSFWRFSGPRSITGLCQTVLQRADIVVVAAVRGPADAAVYAAATRFLVVGQLGAGAVGSSIQPKIASLVARQDVAGARDLYRVSTTWLVLLTWPLYLLTAVHAQDLLRVFGTGYADGAVVVVVLSLVMLVATGCGSVDVVLTMAGRTSWVMGNAVLGLTTNLVLLALLVPPLGVLGAALAWAAAILVNNLLPLAQLAISLDIHPLGRSSATAALLAVGCFGVFPLLGRLTLPHELVAQLLVVALAVGLYAALVLRGRRLLAVDALVSLRRRTR
ncbi:polysaccharide biosynthesis C-terminal domain-containing protein [Pseudokineococcus marinus]|uniref:Oligosaccharide flippase family protein n=1 Tax=Pseudokineococcus marinus TaxID=351215 RepID=A0A849BK72_9ACTN|nr:polysaccharide biosynthesis C-terminal domain-containing protein [Pseudokineococcus marinus]NNH21683.1 oligosaccharide flippase family protein [Pseudokineococcus marinus]